MSMNVSDVTGTGSLDGLMLMPECKEKLEEIFSRLLQEKKEEYYERIESGSDEQSFQIGACSFTEEEWKKLLLGFDAAMDRLHSEEEVREAIEEAQGEDKSDTALPEKSAELLLAEFTTAIYESNVSDVDDDIYLTFYTPDGIYCRKQGESEIEWQIKFDDISQYEKVMSFIKEFSSWDNVRFACNKVFWEDFLEGKNDMDGFNEFLDTRVVSGVPNYLNVHEDGVSVDKKAAGYSKYMNQPDFVKNICYSLEEMLEKFKPNKVDGDKKVSHTVVDLNDMGSYYANHPNEIGKKNHYYKGRWYSMAELAFIWKKELKELFG